MHELNKVKLHFNKAKKSYDEHCHLQTVTGEKLISLVKPYASSSQRMIDLGCGTGLVTKKLAAACDYHDFHAIDIANELLLIAKDRLTPFNIKVYESDFNAVPATHLPFDMVYSNLALHWSHDLEQTFSAVKPIIKETGIMAFSIPLLGTLSELKWNYALNHFLPLLAIEEQLTRQGYQLLTHHQENIVLRFDDVLSTLRSIKNIGANYVGKRVNKGLRGKSFLRLRMLQQLTYVIGYFVVGKK